MPANLGGCQSSGFVLSVFGAGFEEAGWDAVGLDKGLVSPGVADKDKDVRVKINWSPTGIAEAANEERLAPRSSIMIIKNDEVKAITVV